MQTPLQILKTFADQTLRTVVGLFYVPPQIASLSIEQLSELKLTFDLGSLVFRCASDGESIMIEKKTLAPVDLGEFGELRTVNLNSTPPLAPLINGKLQTIHPVMSSNDQIPIGVKLTFSTGYIVICNWGDNLKIWDHVPEKLFKDDGIQVTSM